MKRLFALLLALTLIFCVFAEEEDEKIIRLQTDPVTYLKYDKMIGDWDLYDETGIIESSYTIYDYGEEKYAYLVYHRGKCGYLSLDGRWIFEPQFDDAFFFSDGIACVGVDGLLGFINIDGQYIIEPRFDDALYFNDGLCAVTEDGEKWGFIDKQGNWAIEPKYDGCYYGGFTFGTGLAVVSYADDPKEILIDKEGRELLHGIEIEVFSDGSVSAYFEWDGDWQYFRITENGLEEVTVVENDMYLSDYYPFKGKKVATLDYEADFAFDGKNPLPRLDGATALLPVYAALAQAVYPDDTRYEDYYDYSYRFAGSDVLFTCTKTNKAYDRLVDGETDIIFCAEPSEEQIKDAKAKNVEFEYTLFGYESFVFIVNPENPLDGLTVDQIKAIYSGELTTWDELGVEGLGEIIPYQRPKNSGSQTALEKLMGDTPIMEAPQMYVSDGMEDILQTIEYRNLPNAIGYTFRFFCADMVGSKVKLLAIDGVEPTVENISNGKYPIITPLYAVTRKGETNPNVKRLLDFLTDPQGQELVEKSGYVGLGN